MSATFVLVPMINTPLRNDTVIQYAINSIRNNAMAAAKHSHSESSPVGFGGRVSIAPATAQNMSVPMVA